MTDKIRDLLEKAHGNRHLLYASLELTYRCNFACRFCYNPVEREGQERKLAPGAPAGNALELHEILSLMDGLRKAGVLYFTLTGGEPMVHPRFWEVLEEAKKRAFLVRVFTNGALIDEKAADRFEKVFPNCVEVSLYGASEESYEKSSGRGESFPRVVRALELLKERGLTVYLKCMLTSVTENEMDEVQDIADRFGFPLSWDPVLQVSDDGDDYPVKMSASTGAVERLFSGGRFAFGASPFEGDERKSACNIGRNLIHIDPFGDIFPCLQWREKVGNVRKDDISVLWRTSPRLLGLMEAAEKIGKRLRENNVTCRHCMGKSNQLYGDPGRPDEAELKVAEIRDRGRRG